MSSSSAAADRLTTENLNKHNQAWNEILQDIDPKATVESVAATWGSVENQTTELGESPRGSQRRFALDSFVQSPRRDGPWFLGDGSGGKGTG